MWSFRHLRRSRKITNLLAEWVFNEVPSWWSRQLRRLNVEGGIGGVGRNVQRYRIWFLGESWERCLSKVWRLRCVALGCIIESMRFQVWLQEMGCREASVAELETELISCELAITDWSLKILFILNLRRKSEAYGLCGWAYGYWGQTFGWNPFRRTHRGVEPRRWRQSWECGCPSGYREEYATNLYLIYSFTLTSLVWVRTWSVRVELLENPLPQYSHMYGVSPVWTRSWFWMGGLKGSGRRLLASKSTQLIILFIRKSRRSDNVMWDTWRWCFSRNRSSQYWHL